MNIKTQEFYNLSEYSSKFSCWSKAQNQKIMIFLLRFVKWRRCFLEKKEYFKFSIISEDAETFMLVANSNNNLDNWSYVNMFLSPEGKILQRHWRGLRLNVRRYRVFDFAMNMWNKACTLHCIYILSHKTEGTCSLVLIHLCPIRLYLEQSECSINEWILG